MYYHSKIKSFLVLSLIVFFANFSFAQEDDLLKELDDLSQDVTTFEPPAFKALQIGNLQSTKIVDKGDLYLIVAHRFGVGKRQCKRIFWLRPSQY